MKLIRFGEKGLEKPGIVDIQGQIRDVSAFGEDYNTRFFETDGPARLQKWYDENKDLPIVTESTRLGEPIQGVGKLVCIGLNYSDHAKEGGFDLPEEPIVFFKATSAISGPYDNLVLPKGSQKTDWEVELAVVIGKEAKYVSKEDAMDYVAGYCVHNDYSEREFQLERSGQWVKGKSCDTFAPLGPWMVTKDEVEDPHNLRLWLKVNGGLMQDGHTSNLVFDIPHLVSYLSQFMSLQPGDIISTGTPAGVGMGMNPQMYLSEGDQVEYGIDGLGVACQYVVAYKVETKLEEV